MNELFEFSEQFRLIRFQVANWGTFCGYHDIPISEKGHLFVGDSGSGKSTLLDAMSVLLVPRRYLNFNAAAREGEKSRGDRNFVSYVRGAWSNRLDEHGSPVIEFLRKDSVWSAIALTYRSDLGREATFLFIGYIKGRSCDNTSVKQIFFYIPRNFSVDEIKDFAKTQFNLSWVLKVAADGAERFDTFATYSAQLMKFFGIRDETVLRLLHKAQSAKNLGDINDFLRNYMLETPRTFTISEGLVSEFSELNSAWLSVCKARDQIAVLSPSREALEDRKKAQAKSDHYQKLSDYVPYWQALCEHERAQSAKAKIEKDLLICKGRLEDLQNEEERLSRVIEDLERRSRESGGDQLEKIKIELQEAKSREIRIARDVERCRESLQQLELAMPKSALEFEEIMQGVREKKESFARELEDLTCQRDKKVGLRKIAERQFASLRHDIEIMEKHRSNIPSELLELRDELCAELGLSEQDLPFVGEHIQIKEEEKKWQGALERVVHQFALSMLVDQDHYQAFSRTVNARHLGTRLVYHRVPSMRVEVFADPEENSLPEKFEIKRSAFNSWIKAELSRRFNYKCIEDPKDLERYEKAVTLSGQVKHNRSRHEKDDRHRVDDPTYWVTGFSIREKLQQLKNKAQQTVDEIEDLKKQSNAIDTRQNTLRNLQNATLRLEGIEWADIDHARVLSLIHDLENSRREIEEGNKELHQINEELNKSKKERNGVREAIRVSDQETGMLKDRLLSCQKICDRTDEIIKGGERNEKYNEELQKTAQAMLKDPARAVQDLDDLNLICSTLIAVLNKKSADFLKKASDREAKTIQYFVEFKRSWPEECTELTADLASCSEFMQKLQQLEKDGLPKYERRFRDLLENTTSQNLVDLYRCIDDERRVIKERLKEVNVSLSQVPFNRNGDEQTHLQILVDDRRLEEIKEFDRMYRSVMEKAASSELTEKEAERRFADLKNLVNKLSCGAADPSYVPTPSDLRWRDNVLDVRQHVEFHGEEFDEDGHVIEIYDSGSGKSGGQRQKLTTTCLAAALRYQLGGTADTKPKYAPVVLDEAFDKADSNFTDISLQIFEQFGFQLIIATPNKWIHTIEPYIGNMHYVVCEDRKSSSLKEIKLKLLLDKGVEQKPKEVGA